MALPREVAPENLFVYGTLRNPDLRRKVIGRHIIPIKRKLPGFHRREINLHGEKYPTVLPGRRTDAVTGDLLHVTTHELSKVDSWEKQHYNRAPLKLQDGTEAWTYLEDKP